MNNAQEVHKQKSFKIDLKLYQQSQNSLIV